MQMQEGEKEWPPIMTKGHVLHRRPFESGPYNKSTKMYVWSRYLTFICVVLEIHGISYMENVTEFREISRNFTELHDTEFGGIPPEF
jgi:hypothetical protein